MRSAALGAALQYLLVHIAGLLTSQQVACSTRAAAEWVA
jgi:hypothetical protein